MLVQLIDSLRNMYHSLTRRLFLGGVAATIGLSATGAAAAQNQGSTYRAELAPVDDGDASGQATLTHVNDSLRFQLSVRQLDKFETAEIIAGVGPKGTESNVVLEEAGRVTRNGDSLTITGTITDDDVIGGDDTVEELVENIENNEHPRIWVFEDDGIVTLDGRITPVS